MILEKLLSIIILILLMISSIVFIYLYIHTYSYKFNPEKYLLNKRIEYRLGENGPVYYDCGGIVTEVYKNMGYEGKKISSKTIVCKKDLSKAKKYDILINPGVHVALITQDYKNGSVQILDYVNTYHYPSYRFHGKINGTYALDKDCLLIK